MTQLSVPMPDDLQRWVDSRVAAEGYADAADYVRQLVQRDQDEYEADIRRVQALIDEGLASGIIDAEPEDVLREIIAEMREARD
ncbi:ribbon-helix-helix domain-containing protein [Sphingomonas lenta]|nr:type II toxin-antitoxin system ParD family antitoxin [Sphingomonas lenta]